MAATGIPKWELEVQCCGTGAPLTANVEHPNWWKFHKRLRTNAAWWSRQEDLVDMHSSSGPWQMWTTDQQSLMVTKACPLATFWYWLFCADLFTADYNARAFFHERYQGQRSVHIWCGSHLDLIYSPEQHQPTYWKLSIYFVSFCQ